MTRLDLSRPASHAEIAAEMYRRGAVIERLEARIDELENALRGAARNDKTRYDHHEARPFDGKSPHPGTIWLTPREIARRFLREPKLATVSDFVAASA